MGATKETAEGKAWRGLLAPLISALVSLAAAATIWFSGPTNNDVSNVDSRVSVLEVQVTDLKHNQMDLSVKVDKILEILSDVRVSVAEIAATKKGK